MKKAILTTAIAALLIFAASCETNAPKQNSAQQEEVTQQEATQQEAEQTADEQFAALMKEIFYRLSASVMPEPLQKEKNHKNVAYGVAEDAEGIYLSDNPRFSNCICYIFDTDYGFGKYSAWNMAGYLTNDEQNIVLMIQYCSCYASSGLYGTSDYSPGYHMVVLNKTLNYNIPTKELTEITCPLEPFTDIELPEFETSFSGEPTIYYYFDKNGFAPSDEPDMYWYGSKDEYFSHYYRNINGLYMANQICLYRKWDGKRFVK
jgi:hypothetical protein